MTSRINFAELNKTYFDVKLPEYESKNANDIIKWCHKYCEGDFIMGVAYASFSNKEDAFAFKLQWG